MKSKLIVLAGLCLLLAACKKRQYPEEQVILGEEEIFFNGFIDNEPLSLRIGTDGYYCYSSYQQRSDSIYIFEGELRKFDCVQPCPLSFKVELSDYRARLPGASVLVDSAFRTGSRHFIPAQPKPSTIKFKARANKEIASVRWDLSSGASFPDSITSYEFGQPGPQTVTLTVRTKGNCESVVVNRIFIGGEKGLLACSIAAQLIQNNNSKFTPGLIGGKPPYRYTWNFGDGGTSNLEEPSHNYQWAGSYPVKLRIEDADNNVCESNYLHVAGQDLSSCTANMQLIYTGSRNAILDGVKLQWTDRSNVILRSDSVAQPAGSYFEIIDSQAYEVNEKGEVGRLLSLRFNVLLINGSRRVWMKSDNATIAVTYK